MTTYSECLEGVHKGGKDYQGTTWLCCGSPVRPVVPTVTSSVPQADGQDSANYPYLYDSVLGHVYLPGSTKQHVPNVRKFETGATRDVDTGKLDVEGFIAPECEQRFAEYMHKHRRQSDGSLRDSDNWQKGMPKHEYMKSLKRHVLDLHLKFRGRPGLYPKDSIEDALCAIRFNADGLLFEILKEKL